MMRRAESIASSGVTHGLDNLPLKDGVLDTDREQDDLLQAPSLEAGIFGVLFTLSQEKNEQHIRYHWILLKILLDAWQLYTTVMAPEMGWHINPEGTMWKCINVLSFQWLGDLGYNWYVAVLYSMAGLLAVNLMLCVWVAWSFKEQKFDYVWPIKVVRGFSYVFLQVFDITSLSFLQLGISCNYVGPIKPHLHMALFPEYSCSTTPQIIHAVVSGILLLLFVAVAMLVNMSEVEVNPAGKTLQALGHSGAEVTAFGIKALMTLVGVFLGWHKVAAVAYLLLTIWLVWEYVRWVPHLLTWVNCLKSGVSMAIFGVAALQVAVVFLTNDAEAGRDSPALTYAMAVSLCPMFLLGAAVAWIRTKLFIKAVVKAFKSTDPEAVKPQDVYHFYHPRDVEIAARSARVWVDLYTLEKTAVRQAEEIIKAGVALFPDSAFASLTYANFMLDMLGFSQTGARQLESVRKLDPGIMCRFMLFVRQQQATQKAASSTVGRGGNMDLLGYVEYQRKQRMVLRHHKDALQAMANFWRILGSSTVSFNSLSKSLEEIDNSVSQAETAYRVVLELYNNSPRLVRLYARFLETIKQDPWAAAEYHAAAERLEENKDEDGQGPMLPDGTPISRMDDVEKGVLVVNAFGDIQVANRKLHSIFGYKKGDLDGKNVTVLMPPHEAKRHPALLRRYIDSGDKAAPYFRHPVLAIHRERVAFIVRIAVSRASGLGEDSVFIGLLEALPTEPGVGRVWVTREGVIVCCDPGFVTCFGYHPEDVIGTQLDKLLRSGDYDPEAARNADVWMASKANHDTHELVQRMLDTAVDYGASTSPNRPEPKPMTCSVLHKYDFAKPVTVTVRADIDKSAIFEIRMRLVSNEPQLLMVVERKGAIRHMSGDLAKILGVGLSDGSAVARAPGVGGIAPAAVTDNVMADDQVMLELMSEEPQRSLDDFLPLPWRIMHYKYRKYITGGSSNLSAAWGCRAAMAQTSSRVGPTMRLVGVHGKPVYVHVAVTSREEEGEPMHVVRMARSSLETAVAERRLRLRVSEEGTVQELYLPNTLVKLLGDGASKLADELFGFSAEQLVGCRLWDFVYITSRYGSNGSSLGQPTERDAFITEAEGLVVGLSRVSRDDKAREPPAKTDSTSFDFKTFDGMVTSALQTPGVSWRVNIFPPSARAEAAAMGNPARAAAVLARRTKQAILRLDVSLPSAGPAQGTEFGKLVIHAELWVAEAVTGVLELDATGRVSSILEEEIRPPSLLFGLPKEDILGAQFGSLIRLAPSQSAPGLLTESGVAKKSSLKASTSRKNKVIDKVGPVHYLDGFHRDHQPLLLAVQVVGKPGPGNPVTVILRLITSNNTDHMRRAKQQHQLQLHRQSAAGGLAPAHRAHIALDLGYQAASTMSGAQVAGGSSFQLRLREASLRPSMSFRALLSSDGRTIDPRGPDGSPTGPAAPRTASLKLTSQSQLGGDVPLRLGKAQGRPDAPSRFGQAQRGAEEPLRLSIDRQPGPDSQVRLTSQPQAGSEAQLRLPSQATDCLGVFDASVQPPPAASGPRPPGASALAAGVACIIRAKVIPRNDTEVAAAGSTGCATGMAAAADGAGFLKGTDTSSPLKPESPPIADPSKRPSFSPRMDAGLGLEDDKRDSSMDGMQSSNSSDKRQAGSSVQGPRGASIGSLMDGLTLDKAVLALSAAVDCEKGIDAGMAGVDKWVASGGEYYRNRHPSIDGMVRSRSGGLLGDAEEEEEEDDLGSFGAASGATSSHYWGSPRASGAGVPGEIADAPAQAQPRGQAHMQHPVPMPRREGAMPPRGGLSPPQPDNAAEVTMGVEGPELLPPVNPAAPSMPVDDLPDEHSDGGESAVSGMSGMSGTSDQNTPADFKRGKRYRKLVKLMDSPQAQKAVVRLKINTILAVFAAAAVHIICFAFIITAVKKQSRALDQLATAGDGQRYLQRALVAVRALDQAYKGKGSDNTYNISEAEGFANDLIKYAGLHRSVNNDLLASTGQSVEDLYYMHKITVLSGYNLTTRAPFFESVSLLDMITRIFVNAKTIFQNHAEWHEKGLNISSRLPAAVLLESGQELILGMRQVLDDLLHDAITYTNAVNVLQLTFLILEGCVVTSVCAMVMIYILRKASDQRYQLYETFLKIPVGLTRALASQTTHLLDDDESDSEEDEDGAGSQSKDDAVGHKRKAAFEDNNSTTAKDQDRGGKSHAHGRESPARATSARQRGGAASKMLQEDSVRALLPTASKIRGFDSPVARSHHTVGPTLGGGLNSDHYTLLLSNSGREQPKSPGWWSRIVRKLWPTNSVLPLPNQSPALGEGPRRFLERNSNVVRNMLATVIIYSILIVIFYSVAYAILVGIKDLVALQAVADHNTERTYRAVFYAQELASEENMAGLLTRVESVRNASIALRDAYYTLRMGAHAWTAVGPDIERFPMVVGNGVVKESSTLFNLFYASDACLRLGEHVPCPGSSYPFYQVTRSGVDGMMSQMLLELKYLADEAEAACVAGLNHTGLKSPRWDYIYNVGTADLNDGNMRISGAHNASIKSVFNAVVVMHAVLFLLLGGVFMGFLVFVYVPLLRRMNKEKRRIAEMMSQLPAELDVMRLVITALMGSKPHASRHASRRMTAITPVLDGPGAASAGGRFLQKTLSGEAVAPLGGSGIVVPTVGSVTGGASRAYQTWKDILNRASSLSNATAAAAPKDPGSGMRRLQ